METAFPAAVQTARTLPVGVKCMLMIQAQSCESHSDSKRQNEDSSCYGLNYVAMPSATEQLNRKDIPMELSTNVDPALNCDEPHPLSKDISTKHCILAEGLASQMVLN